MKPDMTVVINTRDAKGVRRFDKLYLCFEAMKIGFFSGCHPLIGVDGCFLKGPYGGILLIVVGMDPNNNQFLIVFISVHRESGDT